MLVSDVEQLKVLILSLNVKRALKPTGFMALSLVPVATRHNSRVLSRFPSQHKRR